MFSSDQLRVVSFRSAGFGWSVYVAMGGREGRPAEFRSYYVHIIHEDCIRATTFVEIFDSIPHSVNLQKYSGVISSKRYGPGIS